MINLSEFEIHGVTVVIQEHEGSFSGRYGWEAFIDGERNGNWLFNSEKEAEIDALRCLGK